MTTTVVICRQFADAFDHAQQQIEQLKGKLAVLQDQLASSKYSHENTQLQLQESRRQFEGLDRLSKQKQQESEKEVASGQADIQVSLSLSLVHGISIQKGVPRCT